VASQQQPDDQPAKTVMGSGPGLLLAHGAGGGIELNFGPVLDRLASQHRVVGVDYPGSGHAPRTGRPLTLDQLADRLLAAADEEGIAQFAIAGYSLGGPVAIRLAARYPDRVSALILTATFARPDARLTLAADIWSQLHATGDHRLLAQFLTLIALSDQALEAAGPDGLRVSIDALAGVIAPGTPEHTALVKQVDVRSDAAGLAVPTLVLATRQDPLVTLRAQRELHALIPGARLIELDSGHLPFVELPEHWANEMLGFLNGLTAEDRDRPLAAGAGR
jgi:3-oxoadipate enol-lactonase